MKSSPVVIFYIALFALVLVFAAFATGSISLPDTSAGDAWLYAHGVTLEKGMTALAILGGLMLFVIFEAT